MDDSTLLDIEGGSNGEMKPRVPNGGVEITRSYRLTLDCDHMFARSLISLSNFKSEKQSCLQQK